MSDWLGSRRSEVACDRILDAAAELFAGRGVESVGMNDIARAAGCSRATLYRYFENRDALHAAYVHRHARAINQQLAKLVARIADPRKRLVAALTHALRLVRENPALAAWFTDSAIGAQAAEGSEVVQAMTAGFLLSVAPDEAAVVERQARWLVRVLTSFLTVPGRDADEERALLEEFVAPLMVAARPSAATKLVRH